MIRSPSRSDSPVKPAMSANMTVRVRIEPPGRGFDALAQQHPHQIRGDVFAERGQPAGHVGDGIRQILKFDNARGMPPHLIEFETLDMLEFVDDRDQRRGDDAPGKPRRQDAGGEHENGQADQQAAGSSFRSGPETPPPE